MKSRRRPSMADADFAIAQRLILDDYNRFLTALPRSGEDASDPKAFAGRHTAARTALAHLEQLQKLVCGGGDEAAAGEITGQLDAARAAMASLRGEGADTDADGDG